MRCLSFRLNHRRDMDAQELALLAADHRSQVREESDSGVCSSGFLPPSVWTSSAGEPPEGDGGRQEVTHGAESAPREQREKTGGEDGGLLEELGRIEADLRESLRLDTERRREAEFLRQQENKVQRTSLCYLSLSQRVNKPWVSSYFRRFPMHIYCLPVQAANHRARRGARTKRK